MRIVRLLLLLLLLPPLAAPATPPRPLDELITQLPKTAGQGPGINEEEQKLAEQLAPHGTAAADRLLLLLSSGDDEIRDLVAYCLRDLPQGSLLPRHLPALTKACRKDRGWLPFAIAGVGGEQAAAFLAAEFHRKPETHAQIDGALRHMAPDSIAPLLREFHAAGPGETEFLHALERVFQEMGTAAAPAVAPLIATAENPKAAKHHRLSAVRALGRIGPAARSAIPRLQALAASQGGLFAEPVYEAVGSSRTPEAALLIAASAEKGSPNGNFLFSLSDIAQCQDVPREASDAVAEYVQHSAAHLRLEAVTTLGALKRPDLAPRLLPALKDKDWRVCFTACRSLAQLRAKETLPAIEDVSRTHWFPRVRRAASSAAKQLRDQATVAGDDSDPHEAGWEDDSLAPATEAQLAKLGIDLPESEILFWAAIKSTPERASFQKKHPRLYAAFRAAALPQWSRHGVVTGILRRGEQTLVGVTADEWVGGLFAVPPRGPSVRILHENIAGVLEWNGKIVVLEGINHMGMDDGFVREVVQRNGKWETLPLHTLPGCPWYGGVLPDGRLLANCQGGAVSISPTGDIKYLANGKDVPDQ